jgi:cyclohexanecarboxylate-CoA ligase
VIVVDGDGPDGFEAAPAGWQRARRRRRPDAATAALQPDDLAVLMFTSGTTGSPKGVMHTLNTPDGLQPVACRRFHLQDDDVLLACSPMGHMTGYAAVFLLGLSLGGTVVLQDVWDARQGVAMMARRAA